MRRERFSGLLPALVTIRVRDAVPNLRRRRFVQEIRRSFAEACERGDFRLLEYSIQTDHVHFVVEADDHEALGRGMKALSARIARAVHRVFDRVGRVLEGRYHVRLLRSPREVWNSLRYVLLNARKHFKQRRGVAPPVQLDEASSARWFSGWLGGGVEPPVAERETAAPRSWLARSGWRRYGSIDPAGVPGTMV